jgi:hypothetical protein
MVQRILEQLATGQFDRTAAWFATVACVGAIAALGVQLAREKVAALVTLIALLVSIGLARLLYASRQRSAVLAKMRDATLPLPLSGVSCGASMPCPRAGNRDPGAIVHSEHRVR